MLIVVSIIVVVETHNYGWLMCVVLVVVHLVVAVAYEAGSVSVGL